VASTVAGSPIPAGDYLVEVTFPFVGRDIPNPIGGGGPDPTVTPITARIVVTVEDHPPVPSAVEAMDAILADPAFTAWLAAHPREIWTSTAMRYVDGAWVAQVRFGTDRMVSARADPTAGAVTLSEGPAPNPRP
jgi:hypothetical protein